MTDFAGYSLVEKRLLRCDSAHADRLLQVYVEDSLDVDTLTYEDLVCPLKTSGGHLSLKVTHADGVASYVRYTPPGYLEIVEDGNEVPPTTVPPHDIERWATADTHDVTVVPIEDTPFVGGGGT